MNWGISLIEGNIGMLITTWLPLVAVVLGGMIFYARSFILGVVLQMVLSGGCFVVFYLLGKDFRVSITLFFVFFIIMVLSLFFTNKQTQKGTIA
jgi:hypothetical protein